MANHLTVTVNGEQFNARAGERLLDAAMRSGVDLPHDCRSGHCGACTIQVKKGLTLDGETGEPGCVRACQARVFSDLDLALGDLPQPHRVTGTVSSIVDLAANILEVSITLDANLDWVPGQYCKVKFKGYPSRSFSPTACLETGEFGDSLRFHIKQVRDGQVTPQLGAKINVGHKVQIDGPYGSAHLRPAKKNRLVLVGSGTGFAPIWAVAAAALAEFADREMVLVCGARNAVSFYMANALRLAKMHSRVLVIPTLEEMQRQSHILVEGTPAQNLPDLDGDDIVYAAGSPKMVSKVAEAARHAGAIFYADPFESGHKRQFSPVNSLRRFFQAPRAPALAA